MRAYYLTMSASHFRYRKVTPDLLEFMKDLRKYGLSYHQIATVCDLKCSSVQYHLDPKYHTHHIQKENQRNKTTKVKEYVKRRNTTEEKRTWMRNYMHQRYHEDPEFRKRVIASVILSQKKASTRAVKVP